MIVELRSSSSVLASKESILLAMCHEEELRRVDHEI